MEVLDHGLVTRQYPAECCIARQLRQGGLDTLRWPSRNETELHEEAVVPEPDNLADIAMISQSFVLKGSDPYLSKYVTPELVHGS